MPIYRGSTAVRDVYAGTRRVNKVYRGNTVVYSRPGVAHASISGFGARVGSNPLQPRLTINRDTDLPESVTIRADLTGAPQGWTLYRVLPSGSRQQVAAGAPGSPSRVSYIENLSSAFRPTAAGWTYTLVAHAADSDGDAHASIVVRSIAAPTLTSFTFQLTSSQAPGILTQSAWLSWAATAGDPSASWSMSQSGTTAVSDLPSSRNLSPASGRATGTSRVRVTVTGTPGGTTTLTLTGRNEAGSASRSVTITWA